jgi:phage tail sheath gpL-like
MSLPSSAISRVTGVNVEYRNFNTGNGGFLPQRLALFGVGNSDAVYPTEKYEITGTADEVAKRYGYGSPLHLAARQLFPTGGGGATFPVTIFPLIPANGAVAAAGAIALDGIPAAAGSGVVRIGGIEAEFPIAKAATVTETLTAIKTTINTKLEMPVIAGDIDDDELTLTAKWKGETGNEIVIKVSTIVEGLTFSITAMSGDALDPDDEPALVGSQQRKCGLMGGPGGPRPPGGALRGRAPLRGVPEAVGCRQGGDFPLLSMPHILYVDCLLAAIGQIWKTFILSCFTWKKTSRLDRYQTFCEGRWGEFEKKPCLVAHGCVDDYATRTAITDVRKYDYANFLIPSVGSDELSFVIAARGLVGDIMTNANSNPPLGYSGKLTGLAAGPDGAQENYQTRNNSVAKGASTNIKTGSVAELNDIITFYHPDGEAIPSRRYVVDLVKLMNIVFNVRLILEADEKKGAPLVSDTTPTTNPRAIQPKTVKAELMNLANSLSREAITQEPEFTKENLSVKIDSSNPKRLNVKYPCKLSGNVEVTGADIYFGFYLETA